MKRSLGAALVVGLMLTGTAAAHDHPSPGFVPTVPGPAMTFNSSPAGAWELIATIPTGNPHTDLDFFTKNGEIYASVGTLAIGPNGGQTIVRLTSGGEVTASSPVFVGDHPSASCVSDASAATGLQHDAEAAPKGQVIFNTTFPTGVSPVTSDAQLVLDATDNEGRCHDQQLFGLGTAEPQGGLEIIDISNPAAPFEIGLTSHIGESHTVNVDPKRPHIAYAVTSDFVTVTCNADDTVCLRNDEDANPATTQGLLLDGFEVVDFRSCMNLGVASMDFKRMMCRPVVYRYRWPTVRMGLGHTHDSLAACHELEIYPTDRLTCAGVNATMLFDMSGAFDDNGTPNNYTDDTPKGTPLPCRVRGSMSAAPFATGAKVTDCVNTDADADNELSIEGWKALGSPSLTGVKFLGSAIHQGRVGNTPPMYDSTQDVEISHEAELTGSGKFILTTDERGGGVLPPGASCDPLNANLSGNGGIHAYRVDKLLSQSPSGPDAAAATTAWESYAQTPGGGKAIIRVPIHTGPQGALCTSHVFHQIPGQNRIFMAWYTQGTHVIDFVEKPNGTIEFTEVGYFIPANANQWVSAAFKMKLNGDGTYTYWGATGDFNLGAAGRNAIDVWKVTLPPPPKPLSQGGGTEGDKTTGGGWLHDDAGKKINLAFNVRRTASGVDGQLQLNDKPEGVQIDLKQVTTLGAVTQPCGSVPEAPNSLQFTGEGTYNGVSAKFRVCVQDNGEGSKAPGADRFYLECTMSCGYNTGARTPDDAIDGGNIQVRRSTAATTSASPAPATLVLNPVLATQGVAGQTQVFSVTVYDQSQNPLPNAKVALTRTTAGGTQTLTAVTASTGIATIAATNLTQLAEYIATAGGVRSNAVELTPIRP
jgi:hypothetical protein